ncbi:hypothetical protein [Pedobacter sp. SL55]|uniref:hypothetical protein n=1 Tax=Pedobacter sp. SL55 TaxID=2995161 RepID=UPI00227141F8|nr:hypothetical protein [Pedobacter sp. SL55]WAC38978.1 hypothetical protein OVA16_10145 [Pedobacter sp. SL55]
MPDKDFDQLFKDRFTDAEIEPSADLWGNIAGQLEPKKKRPFPVLWMAAASVAVVASVMLFTQRSEKVQLQGASEELAVVKPANESQTLQVAAIEETATGKATVLSDAAVSNRRLVSNTIAKVTSPTEIKEVEKNNFIAMQPSESSDRLDIKREQIKPLDVTPKETILKENAEEIMMARVVDTKGTGVAYVDPDEETNDNKKGIRNVGDLVNYVVDKVDKRDKKLIRFDTDDDDNSSIIGLNIGFLKLNKKK